jgi:hypothetical protein
VVRFLLVFALFALVLLIWSFFDVLQCQVPQIGSRARWIAVVLLLPIVGPLLWIYYGRPRAPKRRFRRGSGPDDDQDFLRNL